MSDFSDVQKKSANSCLLSIVIPAYNVEKYVRQCIDSVLNIVPNDGTVEIIIVNDGSTDTTREILTEYNSEKCVHSTYCHVSISNDWYLLFQDFQFGQCK